MSNIIDDIRKELKQKSNENTRKNGQKFFKEKIQPHGVKTSVVRKTGIEFFNKIKEKDKREIFDLCEELWKSGYLEESFIACHWSHYIRKHYEPRDFPVFEHWVGEYVDNWASCDTLCNHTIGSFLEMYPEFLSRLKFWARSGNRWMRRASAVSLIVPARHGKFLNEIFGIADILLLDTDDMVQKGYGWMLKVASQTHLSEVFEYVVSNKNDMPRTALRYAIEKMPGNMKIIAMKK